MAGLEKKEGLRISSCLFRACGTVLLRVLSADDSGRYAAWRCYRGSSIVVGICDKGENRLWGWSHDFGVRYFFGICRKFGAALYRTVSGGIGSAVFNCSKKKRTEVSDTLYSFFTGGVFVFINMKKREWNGALTVEASIYIPMLLFLYLFVMRTGMELYTETREMAVQIQTEETVDVLKLFYRKEGVEDLLEYGN